MFYVAELQTTPASADAELADADGYLLRDIACERPMLVSVLGGKVGFWLLLYCIELCLFNVPLICFVSTLLIIVYLKPEVK